MSQTATPESVELPVRDSAGKEIGKRLVSGSILAVKTNPGVVHQAVRLQQNRKRAGTAAVQTRAEMTGGGRKPWKQKGTGNARAGSNTSPLWVGGGIAHGPKPRSYDFRMNRKEKRAALKAALTDRFNNSKLLVVESLGLEKISTKAGVAALKRLGAEGKSLVVLSDLSGNEARSLRNISGVKLVNPAGLNVYDVVNADTVVFTTEAFDKAEASLA
jgi:large subunit ribosomal protein L4